MATMQKHKDSWYCNVSITNKETKQRTRKWINLETGDKTEARKRRAKVEKVEDDMRNGMEFTFPWQKGGGRMKVKELTLEEAINDWMERRRKQPDISKATIQINENSIDHLYSCVGRTAPLKSITTKSMDDYSDYLVSKGLAISTVNIHLRSARTFFRYVWKRGMIDRLPMIEQLKVADTLPIFSPDG